MFLRLRNRLTTGFLFLRRLSSLAFSPCRHHRTQRKPPLLFCKADNSLSKCSSKYELASALSDDFVSSLSCFAFRVLILSLRSNSFSSFANFCSHSSTSRFTYVASLGIVLHIFSSISSNAP